MNYVLKASYGNDSIALIQWAHEEKLDGVYCLYSDTGWAAPWWPERVDRGELLARSYGFVPVRVTSCGMEALVKNRRGWPGGNSKFCTTYLKILPYQSWLREFDPGEELTALCGVRREESAERRNWPEFVENSEYDLGRSLWSPLVTYTAAQRDELIRRAGWEPLPHRSRECSPCVNANASDLVQLAELDVAKVERIEAELGCTKKGLPRVMFRSAKHGGAEGIRQVIDWASEPSGHYSPDQMRFPCDSGFCGE